MQVFDKIKEMLDSNSAEYRVIEHAQAASAKEYQEVLGTDLRQQLKAVFVKFSKDHKQEFAVCVVPANFKLDLKKVAEYFKVENVSMGSPEELFRFTFCKFGMLPPFGKLFNINEVVDSTIFSFNFDELAFNAGSLVKSVFIKKESYKEIVKDSIEEIIVEDISY